MHSFFFRLKKTTKCFHSYCIAFLQFTTIVRNAYIKCFVNVEFLYRSLPKCTIFFYEVIIGSMSNGYNHSADDITNQYFDQFFNWKVENCNWSESFGPMKCASRTQVWRLGPIEVCEFCFPHVQTCPHPRIVQLSDNSYVKVSVLELICSLLSWLIRNKMPSCTCIMKYTVVVIFL